MMKCRVCTEFKATRFTIKKMSYLRCEKCGSICTDTSCFDTKEGQRVRYEKHNNLLSDEGYRSFLESFIKPVLSEIENKTVLNRILDYGSGPEPALCCLLDVFINNGTFLSKSCEIRGWDPFFAPDTPFFENGADLVTCLEVAEHFENPFEDMMKLSSACRKGGYVAIGTLLLPDEPGADSGCENDAFRNWWYRSDRTHVAFYTMQGLIRCAENAGLTFMKAVTDRAFLFRKTA